MTILRRSFLIVCCVAMVQGCSWTDSTRSTTWPPSGVVLSFDKQTGTSAQTLLPGAVETAPGIRGNGRRVAQGGSPELVQADGSLLNGAEGSLFVWWRPEWTLRDTQRDFGRPGSIRQGFYSLPVDRPLRSPVWHHLAVTWNTRKEVRHYVDGELVACEVLEASKLGQSDKLWLGCDTVWAFSKDPPAGPPWAVTVDEFTIFPKALSVEEIQAAYLAGKIACGELTPAQVLGDRVIDVRLGDKILVGYQMRNQCGFPSIVKDDDGTLYLFGKIGGEFSTGIRWFRSTDAGKTWTQTGTGANLDEPQKRADPGDPASPSAEISRFVALRGVPTVGGSKMVVNWGVQTSETGTIEGSLCYLDESGTELPEGKATLELPFKRYRAAEAARMELPVVVRALDGGLLNVVYVSQTGQKNAQAMLIKSSDEGHTWKYLSTIAPDGTGIFRENTNESALFRGADGSLVCIVRTGAPLIIARSLDDGRTWQPWDFLGVVGVMPDAITLSDGLIACATGRPDVNLLVSLDKDGRQWADPFQVYNANRAPHEFVNDWHQHGTFYAHLAEAEPGRILVLYDTSGTVTIPGRLPRNELCIQEVLVDSIPDFDRARKETLPVTSPRLSFGAGWTLPRPAKWAPPPYASTSRDGAEVTVGFSGTGLAAQVMLLPDGGDIEVWIDGKLERTVQTAGSQTYWLARQVLARGLSPGTHEARLVARCAGITLPALPTIQELMRGSPPEVVVDSRGVTRVVLQTLEPFAE